MNTLFGQAPQATFSTQPTIDQAQSGIIGTTFADLVNTLQGPTGAVSAAGDVTASAVPALQTALQYQTPQATAPAPIDATQAIRQGIAGPITDDFLARTLPSIAGAYGRGAGGAFGSESAQARASAASDAERLIGQQGSQLALATGAQNQQTALQTALANLTATNQAQQLRNAALGISPQVAGIQAGGLAPLLQILMQLGTAQTQQTSGIGTGGSTGLIPSLLSGVGSTAGGIALANALKPT